MILLINVQQIVLTIGWVAFFLLILVIIYRLYIRKIKQKREQRDLFKKLYINLHPIKNDPANGIVPIFIEAHQVIQVKLRIFSPQLAIDKIIEERALKKGGNVIQFDTTVFQNGTYFYEVITDNQKTKKRIHIFN